MQVEPRNCHASSMPSQTFHAAFSAREALAGDVQDSASVGFDIGRATALALDCTPAKRAICAAAVRGYADRWYPKCSRPLSTNGPTVQTAAELRAIIRQQARAEAIVAILRAANAGKVKRAAVETC